jgi:FKBP-type peptidyl-prolyl cis-trans isomerase
MRLHINFILIVFFNFITCSLFSEDIPKNLIIKVIEESENQTGVKSENSDLITVNYTGWIFDKSVATNNHCDAKGEMFDSSILERFNHVDPFQFILGKGIVIKGWDLGLKDMKINEKRCLIIPPHLAYGDRRIGDIIKPNSTLIFEVKLLEILKVEK